MRLNTNKLELNLPAAQISLRRDDGSRAESVCVSIDHRRAAGFLNTQHFKPRGSLIGRDFPPRSRPIRPLVHHPLSGTHGSSWWGTFAHHILVYETNSSSHTLNPVCSFHNQFRRLKMKPTPPLCYLSTSCQIYPDYFKKNHRR